MKVLIIHNYHRTGSASGDDEVYNNEAKLLEDNGVKVVKYNVKNDEFDNASVFGKICATLGMVWSFKHYNAVSNIVKKEKPDIVHVHTFFPLLSPSMLYAAKRNGAKVVATLHDTRFVCPCATSLRGDTICNECGDGKYFRMCKHKCFKNSLLMSFWVACVFKYHRLRKSFYDQIDRYICLNDTQIELLTSIGFDKNKIVKKYNFIKKQPRTMPESSRNSIFDAGIGTVKGKGLPERYAVFFGRLGMEKGIHTLMKAWDSSKVEDIPLVMIGGGPLEDEVRTWADKKPNIIYLGYMNHEDCLEIVKNSQFVVFPSIWYEGCSMVEIESQMLGKPIIASDIGFSKELIKEGVNGCLFPPKDSSILAVKARDLWDNKEKLEKMSKASEAEFNNDFSYENNYRKLMKIYEDLMIE